MNIRFRLAACILVCIFLTGASSALAQQKPQWMPGQYGLNAGILPSPGFTYVNMDVNYDAGSFNGPKGNSIPVSSSYNVWAVENMFYYVPNWKVLGGNIGFDIMFPTIATGSLVADFQVPVTGNTLNLAGGGTGLADLWIQPFTIGWHLKRWDIQLADAFMIPTGRYTPGASNNVGSGYFGNHLQTAATYYITKNKGTSANIFTDWEAHGSRSGTNGTSKTPGQAFTDEWGIGQILPLKKDMSKLLQVGFVGYDQWQITNNGGTISIAGIPIPASTLPYYSVHALGGQLNYILPAKNLSFFFKYYHEISASSHTMGNTVVFGGPWTLVGPKPTPAPTPAPKS
jgi:hypothetical protein